MTHDENPKTTTILTVELPLELGERLRMALTRRERPHRTLNDVTLEALEAWLEQEEQNAAL